MPDCPRTLLEQTRKFSAAGIVTHAVNGSRGRKRSARFGKGGNFKITARNGYFPARYTQIDLSRRKGVYALHAGHGYLLLLFNRKSMRRFDLFSRL